MNRSILFALIAVVVLMAVAAGIYTLQKNNTNTSPTNQQAETVNTSEMTQDNNTPKSLRDLMGFASNQMCTFMDAESGSEGTVYVASNKVRGDFMSKNEQTTVNGHMYTDGTEMYFWMDGQKQGFKGDITKFSGTESQQESNQAKTVDPEKKLDYKCQPWTVDSSKFMIPSDIEFVDYSKMMESIPSGMTVPPGSANTKDMCATCERLTGPAAEQCKQALNCN